MWSHRWQPTRLPTPWDSPGKNTGVGCHFLPQCMKVKSESEVFQSVFAIPWTAAYQAPPSMGFSRQEYWSGVPLPSPDNAARYTIFSLSTGWKRWFSQWIGRYIKDQRGESHLNSVRGWRGTAEQHVAPKNLATQCPVSGFVAYSFLMMTPPKTSQAGKYILTNFPGYSHTY